MVQVKGTNIANRGVDNLNKVSWLTDGALPEARLLSVLEFLCRIQYLSPNERRTAASTEFKTDDSLLDFGTKEADIGS